MHEPWIFIAIMSTTGTAIYTVFEKISSVFFTQLQEKLMNLNEHLRQYM